MRRLGSVQQKVPCIFLTEVKEEHSRKRECQQFQVVATKNMNPVALESNIDSAIATEKLDGTCCYVIMHKGQPYLWARLDRKPNKQSEKRFRKYQHSQRGGKDFTWNLEEDFKTVPETWIPAQKVKHHNGHPIPDDHGHIPGWVPVEKNNKMYCWHSSVVDYDEGVALVLRPTADDEEQLEITKVPLSNLLEKTLELIGTNINGNPYGKYYWAHREGGLKETGAKTEFFRQRVNRGAADSGSLEKINCLFNIKTCKPIVELLNKGMGSKKHPVHTLVAHGSVPIRNPPPVDHQQLCSWFLDSKEGQVEGIVWHCNDGTLVKIHRHHLGLTWPDGDTFLNTRPIVIHVDGTVDEDQVISKDLFTAFSRLNGHCFPKLQDLQLAM